MNVASFIKADLNEDRKPFTPQEIERLRTLAIRMDSIMRLRRTMIDKRMLGEPGWDVLLSLYVRDSDQRRVGTTELSRIIDAPLTTCLRWLDYLEQEELIRRLDAHGNRSMKTVELTAKAREKMHAFFWTLLETGLCQEYELPKRMGW